MKKKKKKKNEETHPVFRAIGVSRTQLANMSFDKIVFDLTAGGVYDTFFCSIG